MAEGYEPGAGVRPRGWQANESDASSESEGDINRHTREPTPEVVMRRDEWRALNAAQDAAQGGQADRAAPRGQPRARERSPSSSEELNDSSEESERHEEERREKRRAKRKRGHRSHKNKRSRHSRKKDESSIASLWKNWAMPKIKDETSHEEMRLSWPTWRDMLFKVLEMYKPKRREWTEEEKYMTLMMHGGNVIREVASFKAAVAGEVRGTATESEPLFSNLINRCNVTFRPKDTTMEITILRAMHQKKDESVREFLEKARKQISLCGYRTDEERDRELIMLLKGNTIDAIEISKHATGHNIEQMEALAINLEAIRQREAREKDKLAEKLMPKEEIDVHAVRDFSSRPKQGYAGPNTFRSFNQERSSDPPFPRSGGTQCSRCGRMGGHNDRFGCPAENQTCYSCGKRGHLSRACRSKPRPQGDRQQGQQENFRPSQKGRINQVGERSRGAGSPANQVMKDEDNEWVN